MEYRHIYEVFSSIYLKDYSVFLLEKEYRHNYEVFLSIYFILADLFMMKFSNILKLNFVDKLVL